MTLPEIDGRLGRQGATYFGRRGPWAAHFARSGNNNTTTKGTYERSNTPMGRWPGELFTLYSSLFSLYPLRLYSFLSTLYSLLFNIYSLLLTLFSFPLTSLLFTLYSLLCTLHSVLFTR